MYVHVVYRPGILYPRYMCGLECLAHCIYGFLLCLDMQHMKIYAYEMVCCIKLTFLMQILEIQVFYFHGVEKRRLKKRRDVLNTPFKK